MGFNCLVETNHHTPSYMLFNESAAREFEREFYAQQEENMKIEKQLAQFEELEGLARNAVAALEDSSRRFTEVANSAKKNLAVGVLPPEADDEDMKVLEDLKGFDERLDQQQEERHTAAMKQ